MLKQIIIIVLFFSCINISAQENYKGKILLIDFTYDTRIQSISETTIRNTIAEIERSSPNLFFEKIIWNSDSDINPIIRQWVDALDYNGGRMIKYPKAAYSDMDNKLKEILDVDYFLKISMEKGAFGTKERYRIKLHRTKYKGEINEEEIILPIINSSHLRLEECDSDTSSISNAIKKIFKEYINAPPKINIRIDDKDYISKDTIVSIPSKNILLDLSYSEDSDTGKDKLIYTWKQIGAKGEINPPQNKVLGIKDKVSKQRITPSDLGFYYIEVQGYDGIEKSKKSLIIIEIIEKPQLRISRKNYSEYKNISLFQLLFRPKKFREKIDDEIIASLTNFPGKSWNLGIIDTQSVKPLMSRPIINISQKESPDKNKILAVEGKMGRTGLEIYSFQGEFRGQKSNIEQYQIIHPEWKSLEEFNIGISSFYMPSEKILDKDKFYPYFPVEFSLYTPLFYRKGDIGFLAFGASAYLTALDKKSRKNFGIQFSLKYNRTIAKSTTKSLSLFLKSGFVHVVSPNLDRGYNRWVEFTPMGINFETKNITYIMEPMILNFNIKPFGFFWGTGLKIDYSKILGIHKRRKN